MRSDNFRIQLVGEAYRGVGVPAAPDDQRRYVYLFQQWR